MSYRREIDGLRAVAVIPVILFHAGFGIFSGGFVGVDVFFVISGYLITRILIEDIEAGAFSLRSFYERRARRILPALFLVMGACIPFAWLWMLPDQFKEFGKSLLAVNLFASNIQFWLESGYFAAASEEKPLLHTWSLAVEEQFYLLFPLFLFVTWRLGKLRVFVLIAVIAALSLLFCDWGSRHMPSGNFFLSPNRAWELLAGSLCAFILQDNRPKSSNILSAIGLSLILASIFLYNDETPFPSYFTLAPVVGTALIILFAPSGTLVSRLLSTRLLVGIGLISYSTYLWHQPLFAFARLSSATTPGVELLVFLSAASIGLGYLSWRYVEVPFRTPGGKFFLSGRRILRASLACMLGLSAMGIFSHLTNGRESLWLAFASPKEAEVYHLIAQARESKSALTQDTKECRFLSANLDSKAERRILDCAERYGPGLAVLGDSHAADLVGALISIGEGKFIIGISKGGCRPYRDIEGCSYERFSKFIAHHPGIFDRVIYQQSGNSLITEETGFFDAAWIFRRYGFRDQLPDIRIQEDRVEFVYQYLKELSEFSPTIWLGPRIEPYVPHRFMLRVGCRYKYHLRENQAAAFAQLDRAIRERIARDPADRKPAFRSLMEMIKLDMKKDFMTCDQLYWSDNLHWSAEGERYFAPRLRPLLH